MEHQAEHYGLDNIFRLSKPYEVDTSYFAHTYTQSQNCCGLADIGLFYVRTYYPRESKTWDRHEKREVTIDIPSAMTTRKVTPEEALEFTNGLKRMYCTMHSCLVHVEVIAYSQMLRRSTTPPEDTEFVKALVDAGWEVIKRFTGNYGNALVMLSLDTKTPLKEKPKEADALQKL